MSFSSNVGYLLAGFEYFQGGFAHEVDQSGPRVDQDRTRRALSDGLFTFLLRPYYHRENPKILQKNGTKTNKTLADSHREWTRVDQL
jgi:hypothetical protein